MVATCGTVTGAAEACTTRPRQSPSSCAPWPRPRRGAGRPGRSTHPAHPRGQRAASTLRRPVRARGRRSAARSARDRRRRTGLRTVRASPRRRRHCCPGWRPGRCAAVPDCRVRIIEADPSECFDLLLAGTGGRRGGGRHQRGSRPPTTRASSSSQLLEDPLDLLSPSNHRLAPSADVRLADLARRGVDHGPARVGPTTSCCRPPASPPASPRRARTGPRSGTPAPPWSPPGSAMALIPAAGPPARPGRPGPRAAARRPHPRPARADARARRHRPAARDRVRARGRCGWRRSGSASRTRGRRSVR